jgi:hypothetical protein
MVGAKAPPESGCHGDVEGLGTLAGAIQVRVWARSSIFAGAELLEAPCPALVCYECLEVRGERLADFIGLIDGWDELAPFLEEPIR